MGTDIHQYNLIFKDGDYFLEGEGFYNKTAKYLGWVFDESPNNGPVLYRYYSSYIPEIVPGRNYTMFGILAGVRGDSQYEFEDRQNGYPERLQMLIDASDRIRSKIDDDTHSPVWYWLPQFQKNVTELLKTIKKLTAKMKRYKKMDKCLWDDYKYLTADLERIDEKLKEAKENLGEESWEKSIIFFNFDS